VTRNYDMIGPIVAGDVTADGIDLTLDRTSPIGAFLEDESFQAGEMSFSVYLQRLAAGQTGIVGVPVFLMRGFRQRCFFVQRDAGIASLTDLAHKRIGTNGWPDTGNTWSRLALLDEGVDLGTIEWWVGAIDGATDELFGHRANVVGLPEHVRQTPAGASLVGMLLEGRLDALMIPWPPRGFRDADSPVVRLIADYREAEREYARRVGFCPAHHILGVREELVTRHPEIARSLYDAFERSRRLAEERRWMLADTSPWALTDLEETTKLLGADWQAHGVGPNATMIRALCDTMRAQGLIDAPIAVEQVFADFARLAG
jgi:4,5-dihydroxyphthalate decarboxylase